MSDTPPATTPPTKGERTRERIAQAALELFTEQGFNGTSVRDIAARAGITHVGLLHHFPNKAALLLRVLEHREQQEAIHARHYIEHGNDRLFVWMLDIVDANTRDPDRVALFVRLSAEASAPDHPARAYFARRYERLLAVITHAFETHFAESPPAYDLTPIDAAQRTIALMDGLQLQWLLLPDLVDMSAQVRSHLESLGVTIPAQPES